MELQILFPDNLMTESLIKLERIPCISRINSSFEISFQLPLMDITGYVNNWELEKFYPRFAANGGGEYFYHNFSLITLDKICNGKYSIKDLQFFSRHFGWVSIVENYNYAPEPSYDELEGW